MRYLPAKCQDEHLEYTYDSTGVKVSLKCFVNGCWSDGPARYDCFSK